MNYYNENDPKAAAWLRELIAVGATPPGFVDERSIVEVKPDDLNGFTQCHFFAGIGGWSHALRLANFPDDEPIWTGSCPCQPFSGAGKQAGRNDSRHLWPTWRKLINRACPPIVCGEQVASALGREWLAGVCSNLEVMGYSPAAADLCSAGVGSPNIRQRLYWVAYSNRGRCEQRDASERTVSKFVARSTVRRVAHTDGRNTEDGDVQRGGEHGLVSENGFVGERVGDSTSGGLGADRGTPRQGGHADEPSEALRLDHAEHARLERLAGNVHGGSQPGRIETHAAGSVAQAGGASNFWSEYDLIPCTDGKARRVEPGTFPLDHGLPARVGRLRGYGNAINPELAKIFIQEAINPFRNRHSAGST